MFTSAREYMQTCAFFKILHNTVHISSITSFLNSYLQKMLHRLWKKNKLNKICLKRVYIGSFEEKSPFVCTSVFLFDETLIKEITPLHAPNLIYL